MTLVRTSVHPKVGEKKQRDQRNCAVDWVSHGVISFLPLLLTQCVGSEKLVSAPWLSTFFPTNWQAWYLYIFIKGLGMKNVVCSYYNKYWFSYIYLLWEFPSLFTAFFMQVYIWATRFSLVSLPGYKCLDFQKNWCFNIPSSPNVLTQVQQSLLVVY